MKVIEEIPVCVTMSEYPFGIEPIFIDDTKPEEVVTDGIWLA